MSVDCRNCGAPQTFERYADRLECGFCGTVHVPTAAPLDGLEILDAPTDARCPLGHGALHRARADPPPRLDDADRARRLDCPACGARMTAHPYYGPGRFVIDFCTGCAAVWLDRGELGRAVRGKDGTPW